MPSGYDSNRYTTRLARQRFGEATIGRNKFVPYGWDPYPLSLRVVAPAGAAGGECDADAMCRDAWGWEQWRAANPQER